MDDSEIRIKKDRLEKDLADLGKFGEVAGGGIMRTALSDADLAARDWLKGKMEEAGLQVREDGAANLSGRLPPRAGLSNSPCIAFGSHSDSVPNGGKFDGALGICAGLEVIRAIQESRIALSTPLELLIFTDEEGSHFAGTFGSRAMFNLLAEGEIHKSRAPGQPSIAKSLTRMGKNPEKIGDAVRSPSEFRAFLELHIEQGPVLESLGIPIGIVEGIVFIDRYILRTFGQAGHAGTTPMCFRDDALIKAASLILKVNKVVIDGGSDLVGTIGNVWVHPGAFNIIPGQVDMFLEMRSMKERVLAKARKAIHELVEAEGGAQMEFLLSKGGVYLDSYVAGIIESSCRKRGTGFHRMVSGAGHDAMTFQTLGIPTGMIFIPCKEGKSHCPEETIRLENAVLGTQVLAETIFCLADQIR